jgi:uncharacterized protein (DUF1015 family)
MRKKHYDVKIYFSGYCTYKIEAKDESEAVIKARDLPIKRKEILSNLENWKDADTAEELNYEIDLERISL